MITDLHHFSKRLELRNGYPGETQIFITTRGYSIRLGVVGRLTPRQRDMILMALADRILVHLEFISGTFRMDGPYRRFNRDDDEILAVDWRRRLNLGTRMGRFGFFLQMRRLEMGHSQAEMAAMLGCDRAHLSHLEHGRHWPRSRLRRRIEMIMHLKWD